MLAVAIDCLLFKIYSVNNVYLPRDLLNKIKFPFAKKVLNQNPIPEQLKQIVNRISNTEDKHLDLVLKQEEICFNFRMHEIKNKNELSSVLQKKIDEIGGGETSKYKKNEILYPGKKPNEANNDQDDQADDVHPSTILVSANISPLRTSKRLKTEKGIQINNKRERKIEKLIIMN